MKKALVVLLTVLFALSVTLGAVAAPPSVPGSKGAGVGQSGSQGNDNKGSDNKGSDNKGNDNKGSDNKGNDDKGSDNKDKDNKDNDSKYNENKDNDNKDKDDSDKKGDDGKDKGSRGQSDIADGTDIAATSSYMIGKLGSCDKEGLWVKWELNGNEVRALNQGNRLLFTFDNSAYDYSPDSLEVSAKASTSCQIKTLSGPGSSTEVLWFKIELLSTAGDLWLFGVSRTEPESSTFKDLSNWAFMPVVADLDDPKKDDPKEDDPKEDDPKEDDPKKDDPKEDDPKEDDPKKDDPKKDDPSDKDTKTTTTSGGGVITTGVLEAITVEEEPEVMVPPVEPLVNQFEVVEVVIVAEEPKADLPFTGGNAPFFMSTGMALTGLGLLLRRKLT